MKHILCNHTNIVMQIFMCAARLALINSYDENFAYHSSLNKKHDTEKKRIHPNGHIFKWKQTWEK